MANGRARERCPTPFAHDTAIGLLSGGAASDTCRIVVDQWQLETAVDVLTAATDPEVLEWFADSPAGKSVKKDD